jgi:AraC family ethanolamine operon transcriptional activator
VEAYLASNSQESLYLADLCSVAGVGERTLRYTFQERYGMSPVRYLKLRRLHQVRRALRRADPDLNTVQSVANRCGIWHLGRFASEYRSLFNESPLETLKKTRSPGALERISAIAPRHGSFVSSVPGIG